MFGSAVLEIAIGLTFVYLVLSLACSAGTELIASVVGWRARNLAAGIRNLLNERSPADAAPEQRKTAAQSGSASGMAGESKTTIDGGERTLAQQLYDHPLILGLYRAGKLPSYIPSRTFALALLDIVAPGSRDRSLTARDLREAIAVSRIGQDLQRVLALLVEEAENAQATGEKLRAAGLLDPQKIETPPNQVLAGMEQWFNNAMERVSGWYKRRTQAVIFGLAVLLTIVLNADTVALVRSLSIDSALRETIVARAAQLDERSATAQPDPSAAAVQQRPSEDGASLRQQLAQLRGTALPLGWGADALPPEEERNWFWWLTKIFGLLLTAAAASLGAPFWFDVLNRIVAIRAVGKAPEEAPKPPRQFPIPLGPGQEPPRSSPPSREETGG